MPRENPTLEFTIYKIDPKIVKSALRVSDDEDLSPTAIPGRIIDVLIGNKNLYSYEPLSSPDVEGIAFNTFKESPLAKFVNEIRQTTAIYAGEAVSDEDTDDLFANRTSSLILMTVQKDCVYAFTSGSGAHYIRKYADANFASDFVTKLFYEYEEVVMQDSTDSFLGDTASVTRTLRKETSFDNRTFSSMKREHKLNLGKEAQEALGLTVDTQQFPVKTVVLEASLTSLKLHKSLSLGDAKTVLRHIAATDAKQENFIMNYIASIDKTEIAKENLDAFLFAEMASDEEHCSIEIVGANPAEYLEADEYSLNKPGAGGSVTYLNSQTPFKAKDVKKYLSGQGTLSGQKLMNLYKNSRLVLKREGRGFYFEKLYKSIQALALYDQTEYFLYLGKWFYIPPERSDLIDKRFKKLWDKGIDITNDLRNKFKLSPKDVVGSAATTEDAYNEALRSRQDIIVGHNAKIKNYRIEMSDFMFKHNGVIYIVHSKAIFDAKGARDVLGQAQIAAQRWQRELMSANRIQFLKDYYASIEKCYKKKDHTMPMAESGFVRWFDGADICLMTSYLNCLGTSSISYSAKALTCEHESLMGELGFGFHMLHLV